MLAGVDRGAELLAEAERPTPLAAQTLNQIELRLANLWLQLSQKADTQQRESEMEQRQFEKERVEEFELI